MCKVPGNHSWYTVGAVTTAIGTIEMDMETVRTPLDREGDGGDHWGEATVTERGRGRQSWR